MSSILTEMSDPSPLVYPDYPQVSSDHRRLLVLVRWVSPRAPSPKVMARVMDGLQRGGRISVNSADDVTRYDAFFAYAFSAYLTHFRSRSIEVRFVRSYPVESNGWGDFQHHRALLGLVSVGAYRTAQERRELGRLHDTLKVRLSCFS